MSAPRRLQPLCEKIGAERIELIVRAFYRRLHADAELGPLFAHIDDIAAHENRIVQFWWIAMGGRCAAPAIIDMVGVHRGVGVTAAHLARWLMLLEEVLQEHLPPQLAHDWLHMAQGIGGVLRARLGLGAG